MSPRLSPEQFRTLIAYMRDRDEFRDNLGRDTFLRTYGLQRFIRDLNFDTRAHVFVTQLVTRLVDFGTLDDEWGKEPALNRLITGLKELYEGQAEVLAFLDSLVTPPQAPPPAAPTIASPSPTPSTAYAFLSYSSKDRPFVQQLAADLESRGVKLWWDRQKGSGIQPAADWERVLRAKLDEITHFVSLLTPNSVESNMVRAELQIASSYVPKKVLIPVLVQTLKPNTMPMQLVPLQYMDFTDSAAYAARVDELARVIQGG